MAAIRFENVSKSYPIYDSPGDRLKELVTFNRLEFHRNFWALHDVSFEVARGETFCVIGENGSGKSTLLQLVAGILQPSSGTVEVNRPVKTYSSGMVVRLAFAVAINVDPVILLVDEALAVGDLYFRQRCMRKVHELRAHGITILFVSHAMADVKALGDRAMWLEKGRVMEMGETDRVVSMYMAAMSEKDSAY